MFTTQVKLLHGYCKIEYERRFECITVPRKVEI